MYPVLFQTHGLTLYTYGFCVAVAMIISLVLAEVNAGRFGLEKTTAADALFAFFIFGILGARAMYVWLHLEEYSGDPWGIFRLQEGGLVWYGGLFGASFLGLIYARARSWPILKISDLMAPILPLAHGIGRIGCFLNGCCYGQRTQGSWGVYFPGEPYAKIPSQLYEALGLFLISAVLFWTAARPRRQGVLFLKYLMLYAVLRFLIEFSRGDNNHYFFFTLPQWMSAALFGATTFLWTIQKNKK